MCVYVYAYVGVNFPPSLCLRLRVTAIMDSLMQSKLGNRRFRLVFTVDPIARQFEDRFTI